MGPIVCSVDDSDGARSALRVATRLASLLGAELMLVHVEPSAALPGVGAAPGARERLAEEERSDAERLVARLADEAGVADARRRVEIGPAAETIVAICEESHAELVVVGTRGRSGVRAAVLGSVSNSVAANAPCPCVVVPPGADERFLADAARD